MSFFCDVVSVKWPLSNSGCRIIDVLILANFCRAFAEKDEEKQKRIVERYADFLLQKMVFRDPCCFDTRFTCAYLCACNSFWGDARAVSLQPLRHLLFVVCDGNHWYLYDVGVPKYTVPLTTSVGPSELSSRSTRSYTASKSSSTSRLETKVVPGKTDRVVSVTVSRVDSLGRNVDAKSVPYMVCH